MAGGEGSSKISISTIDSVSRCVLTPCKRRSTISLLCTLSIFSGDISSPFVAVGGGDEKNKEQMNHSLQVSVLLRLQRQIKREQARER